MADTVIYRKLNNEFYKINIEKQRISCIHFSGIYVVSWDFYETIKQYEKIKSQEWRANLHLYYSKNVIKWEYCGENYRTCELNEQSFFDAINKNSRSIGITDKTIFFYNGRLYYACYEMACGFDAYCLRQIDNEKITTITKIKWIRSIEKY